MRSNDAKHGGGTAHDDHTKADNDQGTTTGGEYRSECDQNSRHERG